MSHLLLRLDGVRRRVLVHRRLLAALLAGAAVLLALRSVQTPAPPGVPVVVATRDLAAGTEVTADDVRTREVPPDDVASGALHSPRSAVGQTVASPLRRGEPVTDVRLLTAPLRRSFPGKVVVPVRIGDTGVVRLLHPGDAVDVVAGSDDGREDPEVVASDARVVSVPPAPPGSSGMSDSGALVLLAVSRQEATRASVVGAARFLGVVFTD